MLQPASNQYIVFDGKYVGDAATNVRAFALDGSNNRILEGTIEVNASTGLTFIRFGPTYPILVKKFEVELAGAGPAFTGDPLTVTGRGFALETFYGSTYSISDTQVINNPSGGDVSFNSSLHGKNHWVGSQWAARTNIYFPTGGASLYAYINYSINASPVPFSRFGIPFTTPTKETGGSWGGLFKIYDIVTPTTVSPYLMIASNTNDPEVDFTSTFSMRFMYSATPPVLRSMTIGQASLVG
jgi:hypothetical protein